MRCHEEPRMHFCGLHCIKFTVISKFQVKGLRAQACLSHRRDFFQDGIFQKEFFFSDGFFRLFFFGWAFFGGVASIQKLVYFRFMRFSGRFRPSFTPFGPNYGFPFFMNSIFSFEVEIFFKNDIFQKKYFFSNGFFRLLFFRSEFFGGVDSIQKLVLFRFMKFSGRFRYSFTPVWRKFRIFTFLLTHFFSFEVDRPI